MRDNRLYVLLVSSLGDIGGIDVWTGNILSYYSSFHDTNVKLIHCYPSKFKGSFSGDSVLKRLYNGLYNYSYVIIKVLKRLHSEKIDVIHVSSNGSLGLLKDYCLFRIAKLHRCKCVLHCHYGRIPEILESNGIECKILKRVLKLADSIVTMENGSYSILSPLYPSVHYIPNPLSKEVEFLTDNLTKTAKDENKVLYVGHVVINKGLRELVEACKSIDNVQLHIIGPITDETFADELKKIAGNNNWLFLRGSINHKDVISEMKTTSVLTLPSYSEGFPNVIIEGMACSCPIVATTVGAIPEMLALNSDVPCGIGVEPKMVEPLRDSINYLLNNHQDAEVFGTRARDRVQNEYSVSSVWDKLVAVWQL